MTLADLSSIGSFISGIAVLLSLIYLSIQTRQASKHMKALILQNRVQRIVSHHVAIADKDLVAAWIAESGGAPTEDAIRHRQFWLQGMAYDFSWEDTCFQHDVGLLGDEQFADFRAHVAIILRDPALHRYFSERPVPASGPTKFHKFINAVLAEAKPLAESASSQ